MNYDIYDEKYITKQGETWETISLDFYGTPFYIRELIYCNTQYSDILMFDANVELNIPILDSLKSDTLAPWKRGA